MGAPSLRTTGSVPVGLGTYHLTSDRGVDHEEAIALIQKAFMLGVRTFDTAPMYGLGEAEFILRRALGKNLSQVDLIDKIGRFELSILRRLGDSSYTSVPSMLKQFEHSMRVLNIDRLSTLMVHETDWVEWWPDGWGSRNAPVVQFLSLLKAEGLVDKVGISARKPVVARQLIDSGIFDRILFVHYYNVVWQEASDVIRQASDSGVEVLIGAPFRQGLLVNPTDDALGRLRVEKKQSVPPGVIHRIQKVRSIAERADMSMLELGLRWILSDSNVSKVLVGPRNRAELEDNVRWASYGSLAETLLDELDEVRDIALGTWGEP